MGTIFKKADADVRQKLIFVMALRRHRPIIDADASPFA